MSQDRRPKIIVIAGPTASGKTAFAVDLALSLSGEIVNADSMQVYRGMDIGTAKPTREEQKGIPHYLLNIVNPDEVFNAAIYRRMALPIVNDICSRGKVCLVVGGTGLYIRGLLGGLMKSPPSDPELREKLNMECDIHGTVKLHEELKRLDPECAEGIHPNDRVRLIRALEIIRISKHRSSDLMKRHGFSERSLNALKICLNVDREELYRRIDRRSVMMAEKGLMEETRNLMNKGYSANLKPMKAIGYRHMVRYLQGECSLEETIGSLKRDTRKYAKRQLTWFRAEPDVLWVDPDNINMVLNRISLFLAKGT
ncbi:MAG: tRNA (adenosine(37)-N6)-dimethylallyltransferase MiaA [Proteobacteria bacterium]|nr:tRNA (adenosine(37)-N6)-dimethylallyltransferase MiaA [Desulfobacterales bacterium]MBL7101313.1 tRNA (adenosine(37)-N6)-dimethylallyltransferase MiaA [Desulfobacteraceae bacterium]MBL7171258.1 tRNA (adenosine(37)-N6)-dimethylallyltransferase MiaA [Desulfobacteraceae bacterium]MBU1903089.1 tRNA (adenosine(37)-N6)-dimethylallyltransferase MiaA [Pseudomonadota bacterium]